MYAFASETFQPEHPQPTSPRGAQVVHRPWPGTQLGPSSAQQPLPVSSESPVPRWSAPAAPPDCHGLPRMSTHFHWPGHGPLPGEGDERGALSGTRVPHRILRGLSRGVVWAPGPWRSRWSGAHSAPPHCTGGCPVPLLPHSWPPGGSGRQPGTCESLLAGPSRGGARGRGWHRR